MDEMPDFDTSHETPAAAPKKQRRKPMKRYHGSKRDQRKKATVVPPAKKTRRKRRKVRVARKVTTHPTDKLNNAEFMAAWAVVSALAKFDNDAKKRVLAKAAEAWT